MSRTAPDVDRETVIWHEVECGGYAADLPLWEELARAAPDPLLELGCGTGRVALHLARLGHAVSGIDDDAALLGELGERAAAEGLDLDLHHADAAGFELGRGFGLVLAPMQLIQLLPTPEQRRGCLRAAAAHLQPGGLIVLAIVEEAETGAPSSPPLPDVRELDGWVYSSLPLGARSQCDVLAVERLRQAVAPDGRLRESRSLIELRLIGAGELEDEARGLGLKPRERRRIAASDLHVGSTVVVLEG